MIAEEILAGVEEHQRIGNWSAAGEDCRRILADDPANCAARRLLARSHRGAGNLQAALEMLVELTHDYPADGDCWLELGSAQEDGADLRAALSSFRRAARYAPENPETHSSVGLIEIQNGAFDRAQVAFETAAKIAPDNPVILRLLGFCQAQSGQLNEAIAAYTRALTNDPDNLEILIELADLHRDQGSSAKATQLYQDAYRVDPGDPRVLYRMAREKQEKGLFGDAATFFEQVVEGMPEEPQGWLDYSGVLFKLMKPHEVVDVLLRARLYVGRDPNLETSLGRALIDVGRVEEADEVLTEVLAEHPDHVGALTGSGTAAYALGAMEAGTAAYRRALEINPALSGCMLGLAHAKQLDDVDIISRGLAVEGLSQREYMRMHFAAGIVHEKSKSYGDAFRHYQQGNEMHSWHGRAFDIDRFVRCTEASLRSGKLELGDIADNHDESPVFIIGMPRSGTSLTEQIIATHSQVTGVGEITLLDRLTPALPALGRDLEPLLSLSTQDLNEIAEKYKAGLPGETQGYARVADKGLANYKNLPMIAKAFPGARVIRCRRSAYDICLSCYFTLFAEGNLLYSYDLRTLAQQYLQHEKLMDLWQESLDVPVFSMRYEDLIADPESVSRELIDFVGLEWEDAVLNFHETERAVATASKHQVRKPIYKSSQERWRPYAKYLEPLFDILGKPEGYEGE